MDRRRWEAGKLDSGKLRDVWRNICAIVMVRDMKPGYKNIQDNTQKRKRGVPGLGRDHLDQKLNSISTNAKPSTSANNKIKMALGLNSDSNSAAIKTPVIKRLQNKNQMPLASGQNSDPTSSTMTKTLDSSDNPKVPIPPIFLKSVLWR